MTPNPPFFLKRFVLGPLDNIVYLLGDPVTKEMAVIDPAWNVPLLCEEAEKEGYRITMALLTHAHPDHVNGLSELLARYAVPVYLSAYEFELFVPKVDGLLRTVDQQVIRLGEMDIRCIWTPGHSPGCQCFLIGSHLITGDTVFVDGCGHCKLPGADVRTLYRSLYQIVMRLPDETVIYPGHHYGHAVTDTLGHQKQVNLYLLCKSEAEFVEKRS